MAHSKTIQILFLALFLALVFCKPNTDDKEVENEDKKDHLRTAALKAIKKYSETRKKDIAKAKITQKQEIKQTRKQTQRKSLQKVSYSDLVVKHALAAIIEKVVEVPTRTNEQAKVLLPDLYAALRENQRPMTTVTTSDTKDSVAVPTQICSKIAMATATEIIEQSEAKAQRELMNVAVADPDDTETGNELIKVMFNKLYGNQRQEELQKAFARIEQKMKLPLGTLFRQYKEGVAVPRLPENKPADDKLTVEEDKKKVQKSAIVADLYSTINSMDLTNEQEMTEAVRLMINANLKKIDKEKEAAKDTKPTWKEFLFGK